MENIMYCLKKMRINAPQVIVLKMEMFVNCKYDI